MLGWLALGIYIVGFYVTFRKVVQLVINDVVTSKPGQFDIFLAVLYGMFVSTFWPVVLTGWLLYRLSFPTGLKTANEKLEERERQIEEQRRQIIQMVAEIARLQKLSNSREGTE